MARRGLKVKVLSTAMALSVSVMPLSVMAMEDGVQEETVVEQEAEVNESSVIGDLGSGISAVREGEAEITEYAVPANTYPRWTNEAFDLAQAKAILGALNAYRTANGKSTVTWDMELERAAQVRNVEYGILLSDERPDGTPWYTVSEKTDGEATVTTANYGTDFYQLISDWADLPGIDKDDLFLSPYLQSVAVSAIHVREVMNGEWQDATRWVIEFSAVSGSGDTLGSRGSEVRKEIAVNVLGTPAQLNVKNFVSRMYETILKRAPEDMGLAYYTTGLIDRTMTGASVADEFIFSKEFEMQNNSTDEFINRLYRTFFDRTADAEGKAYWVNLLNKGVTRRSVAASFVNSKEFSMVCNNYGITQGSLALTAAADQNDGLTMYVYRCYTETLGRGAEAEGLEYWTGQILSGQQSPKEVAGSVLFSPEFEMRNTSNEEFVKVLYKTFMGREFDQAGLSYWVNELNTSKSRTDVFEDFAGSKEFSMILAGFGL